MNSVYWYVCRCLCWEVLKLITQEQVNGIKCHWLQGQVYWCVGEECWELGLTC